MIVDRYPSMTSSFLFVKLEYEGAGESEGEGDTHTGD